jgi:hypothetical protein
MSKDDDDFSDIVTELDFVKRPMNVAAFRRDVFARRTFLAAMFDNVVVARGQADESERQLQSWREDASLAHPEEHRIDCDENAIRQALYQDFASTLILLSGASLERLVNSTPINDLRKTEHDLLSQGCASYKPTITFARSIWELANYCRHLGEWRLKATIPSQASEMSHTKKWVSDLVDNHLRLDACGEFLKRCGFASYDDYERALLSCVDHLVKGDTFETSSTPGSVEVRFFFPMLLQNLPD